MNSVDDNRVCSSCRRPKADFDCALCAEPVCRGCDQFLPEGSFAFLPEVADELKHTHYCQACHNAAVEPALTAYQDTLALAREAFIFFSSQKREPPVMKRAKLKIKVTDCADRDETILRLAFLAALQGYNSVLGAEVTQAKVRNEGWQKTAWAGTGLPVNVDVERLERVTRRYQE